MSWLTEFHAVIRDSHQQGAEDNCKAVLFRLKLAEAKRLALSS